MAITNDGKLLLQNKFKTPSVAAYTHARLKGEESFLADPNPVTFLGTVNAISWGTPNASTGLPIVGNESFSITFPSGTGTAAITINAIEIGVLSGQTFTPYAEVDLTPAVFQASGIYTVTSVNINFA